METKIDTISSLESRVGMTPGPRDLKVIDFLDDHSLRWLECSSLLAISLVAREGRGVSVLLAGGDPGFVQGSRQSFIVPRSSLDRPEVIHVGDGFGSLFLIASLRETLRVNGTVGEVTDSEIRFDVTECYLHCAKALMRSRFWEEYASSKVAESETEFCQGARFMFVATANKQLQADLSPKGDPAGKLLHIEENCVWYPDRPGNRRVDGFRNMLSNPAVEIVALIAGGKQVLRIAGQATMFSEHPMQRQFEVEGKLPNIVTRVAIESISLEGNSVLGQAQLWPPKSPKYQFKAAEIWQAHMKASKLEGIGATIAKAAVSVPGVLDQTLKWDYENNMY